MTKDLDMIQHTGNEAVRLLAELQKTPHPANQAAQSPVQKPDLAAPVYTYAGRRYELNGMPDDLKALVKSMEMAESQLRLYEDKCKVLAIGRDSMAAQLKSYLEAVIPLMD